MKNKYFYPIFKLKAKSWIKYWLIKKTKFKGKLSEILEGSSFTLNNTLSMKFNLFEIYGNSVQDGSPSSDNEVPILNAGDNGSITEKIVNRNWFNKNTITEGKYIDNKGNFVNDSSNFVGDFIKLLSIDTNLAYLISATTVRAKRIVYYDNSKTFISRQLIYTTQGKLNIPENASYVRLSCYNDDLESLQLEIIEEGSTATEYVPHEEQTYTIPVLRPMLSLGDVRDCFVKENGNWYERHYIGRHIFTGTETLLNEASLSDVNRYIFSISGVKTSNALSNYYKYLANYTSNTEHFYVGTNQIIVFHSNTITSGANYKTWLSEKYANRAPVYVDYLLATPLDLPCTEEQIDILENIPSTFAGQTNIYSPDEVKPFLKIQYWESDTNG